MAEPDEIPPGFFPNLVDTDELPSADIVPELAKPKESHVDNVPKILENSEMPTNTVSNFAEADKMPTADTVLEQAKSKKLASDTVPETAESMASAGVSQLSSDMVSKLAESKESSFNKTLKTQENSEMSISVITNRTDAFDNAPKIPKNSDAPNDTVPKVAETNELLSADIVSEMAETKESSIGNVLETLGKTEMPTNIIPTLTDPRESLLEIISKIREEFSIANDPRTVELETCVDFPRSAGPEQSPHKTVPKKMIRRWITIIDTVTGQHMQLQIEEKDDEKEEPPANNGQTVPESNEVPAGLNPVMGDFSEVLPADIIAEAFKLSINPWRRLYANKMEDDETLEKEKPLDPPSPPVEKIDDKNKFKAGTFPMRSEPKARRAGRARNRARTLSYLVYEDEAELGSLNEMLLDVVTTMEDLEELSYDSDESTTSSTIEESEVDELPPVVVQIPIPKTEPGTHTELVGEIRDFLIPKTAVAYYGPKFDPENEFSFETVHYLACKLIIPIKMLYSKVRDSVTEPTRPTLPIPITTCVFKITDRNNWTIQLLRDQNLCLTFKPIYQGEWEREKDHSTLPRNKRSGRMEIAHLLTEDTPEAGLRMLQKTLNTMVKMFVFEKINILIKPNFGVMDVPVWNMYSNFHHIHIDNGRNLTPEELGFILKLKTDKLTIYPRVDSGMELNDELQYERIVLRHADWLDPDDGLLRLHSKEMRIGNTTNSRFTVAQVRDYILNWFGDNYDTFQKLWVAVNNQGHTYDEVLYLMTHGLEVKKAPPRSIDRPQNVRIIVVRPNNNKQVLIELNRNNFICEIEVLKKKPLSLPCFYRPGFGFI